MSINETNRGSPPQYGESIQNANAYPPQNNPASQQQNLYASPPGELPYQAQNVYGPPPGVPQRQNQPQNYQPMQPQHPFPNQQQYQALGQPMPPQQRFPNQQQYQSQVYRPQQAQINRPQRAQANRPHQDWAHGMMQCDNSDYCCYVFWCWPCAIADITTLQGNPSDWKCRVWTLIFCYVLCSALSAAAPILQTFMYCAFMFSGVKYIAHRYGITTMPNSFMAWCFCRFQSAPICGFCTACHLCQVGKQLRQPGPVSVELVTKIRENNCFGKAYMRDEDTFCCR